MVIQNNGIEIGAKYKTRLGSGEAYVLDSNLMGPEGEEYKVYKLYNSKKPLSLGTNKVKSSNKITEKNNK